MARNHGGAFARLVAGSVAAATAVAGFTVGLAAPAHAAPVGVTTTLTDPAGNALDGYVTAYALQADGFYDYVTSAYVADGQVAINVEPGTYKFEFDDEDNLFAGEYYNDKATLDTADPVVVSGATALAPVALAARPTLSGQVISPRGKAVEFATVQVINADTGTTATYAYTKADGTWAAGVNPGNYKVRFSASGYAFEFFNNKSTLAAADVVAAGANLGQVTLSKGSVVQGAIVNQAGAPLERAQATVYTTSGAQVGSDLTDAAGNYRIEGVAPGTYAVEFRDPVGEYLTEWHSDKADRATADLVEVGVDAVVPVNASLAPDPAAAIDPAKVDVSGVVRDSSGAAVIGASVSAYDTPGDADEPDSVETVRTNRAGQYFFTGLSETSESTFKVVARDHLAREEGQYTRLTRWFGGTQGYPLATPVTKPAANVNISLPLTGGISGTVTSEAGLDVDGTLVRVFDEQGNPANEVYTSGLAAAVEDDGTYLTTELVPGTYKVQFIDPASLLTVNTGGSDAHAPEWYDNTSFAKAKKIVVTSGKTVTGVNAALSADLRTFRKPEINGKQYLGGKLRAYPGVWSMESGTTYTYEWLIGSAVVGTGSTYEVTRAAKNKRVTLRVTAENGALDGTALVSSQVIKKKPRVKIAVKGTKATVTVSAKKVKAKKFKGKVVVKKIVREDEYGAPVYKKVGKGKLRNGKAVVTLKKLSKGKNKLVFQITLKGGKYGNAEVAKTVKVKKR